MAGDRHTYTPQPDIITDPELLARKEAENGLLQADLAIEIIKAHVKDRERPFRLTHGLILTLNKQALDGIHSLAGTYRNTPAKIEGAKHSPVEPFQVADEMQLMCSYVNENWAEKSALHLASYVLWKLNWIHPFADGNGRTARAISYVVLCAKIDSLLPGTPTIPEQIADDKMPYYKALEAADAVLKADGVVDVSQLEQMLESMLARQLVNAAQQAAGADPSKVDIVSAKIST